ncbi:MAG: amidohydrolase family protein [Acidobacteriota bacterium]
MKRENGERKTEKGRRAFRIGALALCLGTGLGAPQEGMEGAMDLGPYPMPQPTPSEVLIRNATVWTMESDGILQGADVLLRDGKIVQVGKGLSAAEGALVIDGTGKHVTPGLIDCHSHSAVEGFGVNEGTRSVSAEVQIRHVLDPTDRYIYLQLAGGLTAANVLHGSANAIGGQNTVIKLRWGVEDPLDLVLDSAPPGIKFALGENPKQSAFPNLPGLPRRYPQTRMGVEATIRNAFLDALRYRTEWERYESLSDSEKQPTVPPKRDLQLEALVEILAGQRLVHSHSYRADEILMLIRLADEFGFKVQTFQHVLEGYRVADEMAKHGAGGSTFSDWWAYKLEAYEAIPFNAALMTQRGVTVSLNSDSGNLARRLNLEAAKTVRYGGMTPIQALAMVTINPARQLRIDDRTGSLKAGKDADVTVWNGDPLSVYSSVDRTFVDGRLMFSKQADAEHRRKVEEARAQLAEAIRNEGKKADEEEKETEAEVSGAEAVEADGQEAEEASQQEEAQADEEEEEAMPNLAAPAFDYQYSPFANRRPVAIVGATLHTMEGDPIPSGVVVFENGKITAVGRRGTRIPRGAQRIDARGKHLWPGIIHMRTVLGLVEINSVAGSVDTGEMGDWNANIQAHLAVHPASEHIPVSRSGGITHAVVAPQSGIVAGTASLIRLDGWTWEEMTAVPSHSLVINWPGGPSNPFFFLFGGQRQSLEERKKQARKKVKEIDEFFDNAAIYGKAKQEAVQAGRPFDVDPNLDAMQAVLEGRRPLYVSAGDKFAIEDAVKWASQRALRIVIVGGRDAHLVAGMLAERQVPVVLTNVTGDPIRSDDPYDVVYSAPAVLEEAGVLFAIAAGSGLGGSANIRNVTLEAGVAAGFGLDREAAYRSITINPARILGLDSVLGSIAEGKSASLVLTDGDLLEQTTIIEQVFIDGTQPDMQDKHKRLYQKYKNRPKVEE